MVTSIMTKVNTEGRCLRTALRVGDIFFPGNGSSERRGQVDQMEEMSVCRAVGLSMFIHRRGLRDIFRPLSVIINTQPSWSSPASCMKLCPSCMGSLERI